MTLLKHAAELSTKPLLVALILTAAGLLLTLRSRRRAGLWVICVGIFVGYLASTSLLGNALLRTLEQQYTAFDPSQAAGVRDIVVLGSGYEPRDHIPITGALDADGLARIVEGVRLTKSRIGARLLVSGGAERGHMPGAVGYAQLSADLGIQRSNLVILDHASDTAEEARDVFAVLGRAPFILVTSAYHMPRAMWLMRRAGANPIPASTGQLTRIRLINEGLGLIPGSYGLRGTEIALHEYLGLVAVYLGMD